MMVLWIVMAVLTAVTSIAILRPLHRRREDGTSGNEAVAIYAHQLDEIERDLARGLIGEREAESARTEISRRLLKASEASVEPKAGGESSRKLVTAIAIMLVPLAALGIYLAIGNPTLPDQPLAQRQTAPPIQEEVVALIARVEEHLAANPDDGRGWELLGPVYARLGRFDDAAIAFSNAVRLLGSTAEREADLGEALTRANGDIVTAEAREAFERANALDADDIRPRFYLAVALEQEGRAEDAIAAWQGILQGAPADAPWATIARDALERLGAAPVEPGPTQEDIAAAGDMSDEDRAAMIEGMVASLAARLDERPQDPEGWARLVRSYMVLGRQDEALQALARAETALDGDAAGLALVEAAAREAGLERNE